MYVLKQGIKADPHRRWSLPDRIFFGYGACHILAGVFLDQPPLPGFYAERVIPAEGFLGFHVYVTNGVIVFDYHGYSIRDRLLEHHKRVWSGQYAGWFSAIERVDFDLLSTADLNKRQMRGPDQYLHDPIPRARRFIEQRDHANAAAKALAITQVRNGSTGAVMTAAGHVRSAATTGRFQEPVRASRSDQQAT
ncbi:hypothetical protein ABIE89_008176 [Bradyrhizobium niftali]|uniref:hypothetical protein n=1 Tax=Bradyrhizobium niftali TaxID=2560055 RepID=UPI0038346CDF